MKKIGTYWSSAVLGILFCLSLVTDWDMKMVLLVTLISLLTLLHNLGRSIVLRETIGLYTVFICLLMPWLGYVVYNRQNAMATLWVRFMPISADAYFNFMTPAVIGFIMVLCFPLNTEKYPDRDQALTALVRRVRDVLNGNQRIGVILIIVGTLVTAVINYLPVTLQFFFNLLYFSSYAGVLYVFYSRPFPLRKTIIFGFGLFIFLTALRQGMFTVVVYMGMTIFPFFILGTRTALWKKLSFFVAGVFLVALIQSVKPAYRLALWKNKYQGNQVELFTNLVVNKLKNPEGIFNANEFFFIYYRTNQGFNQALVMKYIPAKKPFDNGENLFVSIASSLVPRFIWPDKPEAGGKANMKYYTGYTIKGWATNVGPLGEAYGSFGHFGGIVYMMILGLVIRWFFATVFLVSKRYPLLLLWLPVLFYQVTYSAENDTLQILNSLIKTVIFMYLLYKLVPSVFAPDSGSTTSVAVRRQPGMAT